MSIDALLSAMRSQADTRNMGAAAAKAYLTKIASDEKATLNDAVIEVLRSENLLDKPTTSNFVDRVVEEANKAVFAVKFKTANYTGNIEFPVANASVIKERLTPAKTKTAGFRLSDSRAVIEANRESKARDMMSVLFGSAEKIAEQSKTTEGELLQQFYQLSDQKARLHDEIASLEWRFSDAYEKLASIVEQADNKLVISGCMAAANPSPRMGEFIKLSFSLAADPNALATMNSAGMPPAPGNPVTGLVADLDMIGGKLMTAQMAMSKVMSGMAELQAVLKGSGPTTAQLFAPEAAGGVPPTVPPDAQPGMPSPAQPMPGAPPTPGGM